MKMLDNTSLENVEVTEDDSPTAWRLWDTALAQLDLRISSVSMGSGLKDGVATERDSALEVINMNHTRVAKAIRALWGHQECCAYIETLLLSGTNSNNQNRCGFSQEVVACLFLLISTHEKDFGSREDTKAGDTLFWF
jgi:hypothetical protein